MPCYRCGTRQVDPDRGESPWRRGVRGDRQVLICPACQTAHDWVADLDRCPACSSVRLVRRLGEAECRDCGSVRPPVASALPGHLAALAKGSRAVAGGQAGTPAQAGAAPQAGAAAQAGTVAQAGTAALAGPGAQAGPGGPVSPAGPGGVVAPASESAAMQDLAADVEQALARVLGRTAGSSAGS